MSNRQRGRLDNPQADRVSCVKPGKYGGSLHAGSGYVASLARQRDPGCDSLDAIESPTTTEGVTVQGLDAGSDMPHVASHTEVAHEKPPIEYETTSDPRGKCDEKQVFRSPPAGNKFSPGGGLGVIEQIDRAAPEFLQKWRKRVTVPVRNYILVDRFHGAAIRRAGNRNTQATRVRECLCD